MQVSLNVNCVCGAKMAITPPKEIQQSPEELRYFDINCGYCERLIGKFSFALNLREEEQS